MTTIDILTSVFSILNTAGQHDSYTKGDKVTYNGKKWVSTADNNVWAPGVYGWTES